MHTEIKQFSFSLLLCTNTSVSEASKSFRGERMSVTSPMPSWGAPFTSPRSCPQKWYLQSPAFELLGQRELQCATGAHPIPQNRSQT